MFRTGECIRTKFEEIVGCVFTGDTARAVDLVRIAPIECLEMRDQHRGTIGTYAVESNHQPIIDELQRRFQLGC